MSIEQGDILSVNAKSGVAELKIQKIYGNRVYYNVLQAEGLSYENVDYLSKRIIQESDNFTVVHSA